MPIFLTALQGWARRRKGLAFLVVVGISLLVYWQVTPAATPVVRTAAKAPSVPGIGAEKATMERSLLDLQKSNEQLRLGMEEQQRTARQLQTALASAEQAQKAASDASEKRVEALLKAAQTQQPRPQAPPRPPSQPKPPAPPTPRPVAVPQDVSPALASASKMRVLRIQDKPSFEGQPPSITRGETAYLPAGSFAESRVITGVMATSRAGGAMPVLLAVTKEFAAPFQLRPGQNPVPTALPIQGCFMLGKAAADLGASRVLIQVDLLSCIMPQGDSYERPIRGYVIGVDGTLGVVARVETHDSAAIAKAFLTSLLAGASEAFRQAKQTVVTTPLGGQFTAQNGQVGQTAGYAALANASAQLSQFYLQQASQLLPTLWLESGSAVRVVLQEGLPLDGLPVNTVQLKGE